MNEFLEHLLGGITGGKFAAAMLFSFIGIFLGLLIGTTKRDPLSARTPIKFSWKFLWCDNAVRIYKSILTTVLMLFISIRFVKELFGIELTMIAAFGFGLGIDRLFEFFRKKSKGEVTEKA